MKIWINDGGSPKPTDDFFYEVGANGIFIHKKMKHWHAVVPVKGISFLNETRAEARVFLKPIPENIITSLVRFFAWIYKNKRTEVGALLWLNEEKDTYRVSVPPQAVSHGSIEYKDADGGRLPGEVLIGTVHSHCDMSAFHSGTDTHDEEAIDGIHITFGKFKKYFDYKDFDISAEIAINGARFGLNITDWLLGINENEPQEKTIGYSQFASIMSQEKNSKGRYELANGELILTEAYVPPASWASQIRVLPKPKVGKGKIWRFPFERE